jgi:hypothetical protein
MSDFKPPSEKVKLLKQEAIRNDPYTFKERGQWIRKKVIACNGDEQALDELRDLLGRLPWSYKPITIDNFLKHIKLDLKLSQEFDSISALMTIQEIETRFPIQWYCEEILKLRFKDLKAKCPLHDGKSDTSFVIDPATGVFTCFGGCEPKEEEEEHLTGRVIDLHQRAFTFQTWSEAKKSLEKMAPTGNYVTKDNTPPLFRQPSKPKTVVDDRLVSRILSRCAVVKLVKCEATAFDFSRLLLEKILRPEDKPIVFLNKKWPIIGAKARLELQERPQELQYICCSTAKSAFRNPLRPEDGTNRRANLRERIFLDVEFDHLAFEDQLKILWWLRSVRKWRLITITHSGGKSCHGLFEVRGFKETTVQKMKRLALRLGACRGSLNAHQPVRMPGGTRRENGEGKEQRILFLTDVNSI